MGQLTFISLILNIYNRESHKTSWCQLTNTAGTQKYFANSSVNNVNKITLPKVSGLDFIFKDPIYTAIHFIFEDRTDFISHTNTLSHSYSSSLTFIKRYYVAKMVFSASLHSLSQSSQWLWENNYYPHLAYKEIKLRLTTLVQGHEPSKRRVVRYGTQ